jgi:hypothetical protein
MARKPRKPRKPAPHHTGGFGGWGNTKFPGGSSGGGGGGGGKGKPPRRAHHHHTGGFGGLGNTKFPRRPKRHPKRHLAGPALGGEWITGGNDAADNCAAVAVANSLLLATGLRVSDGELLRLHDRAGPLSIPEALAAAREVHERDVRHVRRRPGPGVQHHPELDAFHLGQLEHLDHVAVALLDRHIPAAVLGRNGHGGHVGGRDPALVFVHPLIVGLDTPHGPHAALLLGAGLVTWGGLMDWPDDWLLEELWEVTW